MRRARNGWGAWPSALPLLTVLLRPAEAGPDPLETYDALLAR